MEHMSPTLRKKKKKEKEEEVDEEKVKLTRGCREQGCGFQKKKQKNNVVYFHHPVW